MRRIPIGPADEIATGGPEARTVEGLRLLFCRVGDEIFAVENQCSHAMARLTRGKVRGYRLFCPLHGAAFDLRDGAALSAPAVKPIRSFRIEIDAGTLYAELPDAGDETTGAGAEPAAAD